MTQPKQANNAEKEQRLNAIIAEYLKRKDAGQNVSKDSMLKAYPDLADGLRSYFQNEVMIGENVPALAATKLSPISPAADMRETLKPGAALADTASEFGNRKFGRYQILRPLGEGAMGSVYLALDTTLDRQVALKVPKTEGTANAEFMARFTREAKAAAGLKHANICRVYDAGEHEGTAYITMDFIDGVPLSRFIGTEKLQSVDSILQMISTIADAVGHAHSKGVIHRDLKPGNILVDADFKPHVTDFGLARRAGGPADESRITQEGLLIGTPAYMAPEQVKGEQAKVGPQSDIYSLGVILFELLTHRLPFEGKVAEMLAKVLRDAPPVPSRIRKDLSEEVDDLCLKMLQKSPEHRFASISELTMKLEALRNRLREASVRSNQPTARQKSPFEIQKAHIELMLKKGQYTAAIQDLEKLAQETLPGAKAVVDWARTKLPIVRKEAKALSPSGLEALLKTAQQMFQKSDYVGCAQLIEDIPPLRRTETMEDLLDKSKRREAEADQLLLAIKDKESRQDIDGLESLVKKLLKLKPGNAYAKRLSEALQSYSKTPATRRKYRYEKGRLQPMPEPSFLRQWAVLGSLVGILVFLSVYSYVIFYLKSGNQTLAVHIDDEWLKSQGGEVTLVVDGDNHTITTPSTGGDPVTVTVSLGQHTFTVKHGDTIVHDPKTFEIEKDGRRVLSITAADVRLENGVPFKRSISSEVALASNGSLMPHPGDKTILLSDLDQIATGSWISLVNSSTVLTNPECMKLVNGVLELDNVRLEFPGILASDCVVRAEMQKTSGLAVGLCVRQSADSEPTKAYELWFEGKQLNAAMFRLSKTGVGESGNAYAPLGNKLVTNEFTEDQFVDVALSAIGDTLTLYVDGKSVHTAKDSDYTSGTFALRALRGIGQFRNVKYQILGAPNFDFTKSSRSIDSPESAIAPFSDIEARTHQETWSAYVGEPVECKNSIGMKLRLIPPGEFLMGSPESETHRNPDEGPQHRVRITNSFYLGKTEVTQAQWVNVMGTHPWQEQVNVSEADDIPASYITWNDAIEFCRKLSAIEGHEYRLPTEAEWEFACRAGTTTAYHFGDDVELLHEYGWLDTNTLLLGKLGAQAVGGKKPNPFGLLDMHGNLFEWCQDFYADLAYQQRSDLTVDPVANVDGGLHITRGGGWDWNGYEIRSAVRGAAGPDFRSERDGIRLVRVINRSGPASPSSQFQSMRGTEVADPRDSLKSISQVHGATAHELVAWAKSLPAAGYRPYWLSVRGNTKPILYDALASKTADQSEWIMQFYDHADETNWAEMKQQYRPALLNVYAKGDIDERLVLWVKDNHQYEYWLGSLGFMEEKLKEGLKWDQGAKSNRERWLPTSIVGHWFEGDPTYDMLMAWQPWHQCEWSLDLPLDELPALVKKYREKGWQPANLNIINGSSPARCSAVFGDNPEKRKWTFSPKLSVNEYRSMLTKVDDLGGQPQCVFSRVENDEVVYSVLWHGVEL